VLGRDDRLGTGPLTPPSSGSCILSTEVEENGFRTLLTVIDTPGFGDYVNNTQRCVLTASSVGGLGNPF
jgi:hypothetical protein